MSDERQCVWGGQIWAALQGSKTYCKLGAGWLVKKRGVSEWAVQERQDFGDEEWQESRTCHQSNWKVHNVQTWSLYEVTD